MPRLFICVLLLTGVVAAQETCTSASEAQGPAVLAFRTINTAELRYFNANQKFAALPELMNSDQTKALLAKSPKQLLGDADDPLPGYVLRLTVAADGKSYAASAIKKDGTCQYYGAATDDRGLIYLLQPLK